MHPVNAWSGQGQNFMIMIFKSKTNFHKDIQQMLIRCYFYTLVQTIHTSAYLTFNNYL